MIEKLTHESFEAHKDTEFELSVGDHSDTLTLTHVHVQHHNPQETHRRGFTLVFKGARTDAVFDGNIYALQHPEMGTLQMFIAPMNRHEDGTFLYQSVFN